MVYRMTMFPVKRLMAVVSITGRLRRSPCAHGTARMYGTVQADLHDVGYTLSRPTASRVAPHTREPACFHYIDVAELIMDKPWRVIRSPDSYSKPSRKAPLRMYVRGMECGERQRDLKSVGGGRHEQFERRVLGASWAHLWGHSGPLCHALSSSSSSSWTSMHRRRATRQ